MDCLGDTLVLEDSPEFVPAVLSPWSPSEDDIPPRRRITPTPVDCAEVGAAFANAKFAPWPHNLPEPLARMAFVNWMFGFLYDHRLPLPALYCAPGVILIE